jgi:hypothetical protein
MRTVGQLIKLFVLTSQLNDLGERSFGIPNVHGNMKPGDAKLLTIPSIFIDVWTGDVQDVPGHQYSRKRPYPVLISLLATGGEAEYKMAHWKSKGVARSVLSLIEVVSDGEIVFAEKIDNSLESDTLTLRITDSGELSCAWQKGGYQSNALLRRKR